MREEWETNGKSLYFKVWMWKISNDLVVPTGFVKFFGGTRGGRASTLLMFWNLAVSSFNFSSNSYVGQSNSSFLRRKQPEAVELAGRLPSAMFPSEDHICLLAKWEKWSVWSPMRPTSSSSSSSSCSLSAFTFLRRYFHRWKHPEAVALGNWWREVGWLRLECSEGYPVHFASSPFVLNFLRSSSRWPPTRDAVHLMKGSLNCPSRPV